MLHLALAGSRLYLGGLSGLRALDPRTGNSITLHVIDAPSQVFPLTTSRTQLLVGGRA